MNSPDMEFIVSQPHVKSKLVFFPKLETIAASGLLLYSLNQTVTPSHLTLFTPASIIETKLLQEMNRVRQLTGVSGGYAYSTTVSAAKPSGDCAPRVIPLRWSGGPT